MTFKHTTVLLKSVQNSETSFSRLLPKQDKQQSNTDNTKSIVCTILYDNGLLKVHTVSQSP